MEEEILDDDYMSAGPSGSISKLTLFELIVVLLMIFAHWTLTSNGSGLAFYGRILPALVMIGLQAVMPFFRMRSTKRPSLAFALALLNFIAWGGLILGILFRLQLWVGGTTLLAAFTLLLIVLFLISPVNEKYYGVERLDNFYLHLFTGAWAIAIFGILGKFESMGFAILYLAGIGLNLAAIVIITMSMYQKERSSYFFFNYLPKSIMFLFWSIGIYW
ncbi:MAG: hypothetical protein AAF990_15580 [Bacteroidota bacterium]